MGTNHILVGRIARVYDPFVVLFEKRLNELPAAFFRCAPEPTYRSAMDASSMYARDELYHRQRVAYFVRHGIPDPIEVDNHWYRWGPGGPIVTDGHHRLCAAILRGQRRIECEYSGLVRTLRWLEGKGRAAVFPWE